MCLCSPSCLCKHEASGRVDLRSLFLEDPRGGSRCTSREFVHFSFSEKRQEGPRHPKVSK